MMNGLAKRPFGPFTSPDSSGCCNRFLFPLYAVHPLRKFFEISSFCPSFSRKDQLSISNGSKVTDNWRFVTRDTLHRQSDTNIYPENLTGYKLSPKVKQLETSGLLQNDCLLKTFLAPQEHIWRCFTFEAIPENRDFAIGKRRQNNNFAVEIFRPIRGQEIRDVTLLRARRRQR